MTHPHGNTLRGLRYEIDGLRQGFDVWPETEQDRAYRWKLSQNNQSSSCSDIPRNHREAIDLIAAATSDDPMRPIHQHSLRLALMEASDLKEQTGADHRLSAVKYDIKMTTGNLRFDNLQCQNELSAKLRRMQPRQPDESPWRNRIIAACLIVAVVAAFAAGWFMRGGM